MLYSPSVKLSKNTIPSDKFCKSIVPLILVILSRFSNEYGRVPPLISNIAFPSLVELQRASVTSIVASSGLGTSIKNSVGNVVHPCPSVTVTEYVPASRFSVGSLIV